GRGYYEFTGFSGRTAVRAENSSGLLTREGTQRGTAATKGKLIAQIETFEKNHFHISGEYGGGRRGVFQQQVTTVDQVAVAALMICMEELIVDAPAIVDQKCIEVFAQKLDRLLLTSAWEECRRWSYRRSPPPRATTDVH